LHLRRVVGVEDVGQIDRLAVVGLTPGLHASKEFAAHRLGHLQSLVDLGHKAGDFSFGRLRVTTDELPIRQQDGDEYRTQDDFDSITFHHVRSIHIALRQSGVVGDAASA
jgi:hypothetical protein